MKTELIHSFSSSSLTGLSRSPSLSTIGKNDPNLTTTSPTAGLVGTTGMQRGKDEKSSVSSWKYQISDYNQGGDDDGDEGCFKGWVKRSFTRKNVARKFPILDWLPKYTVGKAVSDFIAGLTVGLTLIPQGLAMASVAQLPPQVCHTSHLFIILHISSTSRREYVDFLGKRKYMTIR